MFTLRAAPRHYPDFCCSRRPPACRQTFTQRHASRHTYMYPRDSGLRQDMAGIMLLPLFESMMSLASDKQYGQQKRPKARSWVHKIDLRGYEPDDVTITTKVGRVLIKARRKEGDGDCSDVYESNRSVAIPEGVDISSMKSHFTSDGVLTIKANITNKDENEEPLEVPVENTNDKQKSLPSQKGKGDANEDTQTSDVFDYPESDGSVIGKEDFEDVGSEMTNTNDDLDPRGTDFTVDYDQSLTENGDTSLNLNKELDIHHEDVETHDEESVEKCKEDEEGVSDETQKTFKLSFNKDELAGDDVKVLVKGNSLLVKSQSKTCEDGVSRSVYYVTQHTLPDDIDVSKISCSKRSDGELVVTAPYS